MICAKLKNKPEKWTFWGLYICIILFGYCGFNWDPNRKNWNQKKLCFLPPAPVPIIDICLLSGYEMNPVEGFHFSSDKDFSYEATTPNMSVITYRWSRALLLDRFLLFSGSGDLECLEMHMICDCSEILIVLAVDWMLLLVLGNTLRVLRRFCCEDLPVISWSVSISVVMYCYVFHGWE